MGSKVRSGRETGHGKPPRPGAPKPAKRPFNQAGRPTAAELEKRKALVMEIATHLFVAQGYAATSLVDIAKGAGVEHVDSVSTPMDFIGAVADAFEREAFSVIVAKVEAVGPDHFGMDLKLPENAFRFERYIKERRQMREKLNT